MEKPEINIFELESFYYVQNIAKGGLSIVTILIKNFNFHKKIATKGRGGGFLLASRSMQTTLLKTA